MKAIVAKVDLFTQDKGAVRPLNALLERLAAGDLDALLLAFPYNDNRVETLIFADEPTGNLDTRTADEVLKELLQLIRGQNLAALIATHNSELAEQADRIVRLDDGLLVDL